MFWFVMSISSSICSYKYIVYNFVCILCDVVDIYSTGEKNKPATVQRSIWVILGLWGNNTLQSPTELWKKKFNLQAPPVYDRKFTNLFFSIIIVSIFFP